MSNLDTKMTALADAIRDKSGRTDSLTVDEMTIAVSSIEAGTNTSDATATADDILSGKTAYTADGKVTGNIQTFDGSYTCSGESTGGGASVETCSVTIEYNVTVASIEAYSLIYCSTLDNSGNIQPITLQSGVDFVFSGNSWFHIASIAIDNIVKNSILVVMDTFDTPNEYIQHDFELISNTKDANNRVFFIKQNGTITVT